MNLLKNKNTLLILSASGITFLGNGMHFIAISWLILQMAQDPLYVSILVLLETVPGIISSPIAGVIADRYNRKIITIFMDLIRFFVVLSIPIVSSMGLLNIWYLYVATIMITLSSNFFFPAMSGIIKTSFSKDEYLQIISGNNTLIQIGMIGGSGLSGIIISHLSINYIFYINAVTYLLSALLLCFIGYKHVKETTDYECTKKPSMLEDIKIGIKYVKSNRVIVFLFFIGIIPSAVVNIINSMLSVYTDKVLGLGVTAYGILDASFAIGFVVIGIILSSFKQKFSEIALLTNGFLVMSISMILLSIGNSFGVGIFALFLAGVSIILTGTTRKSLLMKQIDDQFIGRVESLNWMVFSSISPLLALFISFFSNYIGIKNSFLIISGSIISLFIILCIKQEFLREEVSKVV
jgi:MFS transporter, DHA3 family, macrolide efflux protein